MDYNDLIQDEPNLTKSVKGTFGSFHTSNSYPVNYLLTSMNYKEIENLEVAAEAFNFEQVNFDEMVQREIDINRVNNEIVSDYLENDIDTALFFPPIIVSVVGFDENENPIHKYDEYSEDILKKGKVDVFYKTWDRHFQLELPISNTGFDSYLSENKGELKIYKHWGALNFDPDLVKFVVIDGQHRFKAIQEYWRRHPNQKSFLNVPVCICFSPKAIESNGSEDILDTLRNMFVTINNTGKKVSGHYIDLLNDRSLASQTVRALANKWKSEELDSLHSKLQHLEWNQRSDSKSRRINRPYSITTVSMLSESIKKSVFSNDKDDSCLFNLMNLSDYKDALESDGLSIHSITEADFTHSQKNTLYKIIEERVVPSIETLLVTPSVYSKKIDSFKAAIDVCVAKELKSEKGYPTLINQLKSFNDVDRKLHTEESYKASQYFNGLISESEHLENYTRLVFNQAYFRVWAKIADCHSVFHSNLKEFTLKFVESLEVLAFNESKMVFSKSRIYNQLTLYKGGKPNTTQFGKECWFDLLMCTFLYSEQFEKIKVWVLSKEDGSIALDRLTTLVEISRRRFLYSIQQELFKDLNKNWKIKDLAMSFRKELEKLEEEDDLNGLRVKLADKAKEQLDIRVDLLSNILSLDAENIKRN